MVADSVNGRRGIADAHRARSGGPSSRSAGFHAVGAAGVVASPWPCALFWGSAPARAEPVIAEPPSSHRITLVGGDKSFRAALLDRLAVAGHCVETVHNLDLLDVAGAGARLERDPGAGEIVLFLSDQSDGDDRSAARQIAALAPVALEAERRRAALWVVTCDAQQAAIAGADTAVGPAGAALWGLARVLVNELPRLSVHLVDLAGAATPGERARQIAAELAAATEEPEIVWTPHGRHVLRLRPGLPPRRALRSEVLTLTSSRAWWAQFAELEGSPATHPFPGRGRD